MNHKFLVVGSDSGTLDLVREARKMGIHVIVADYYETTPTKQIADESWTVSTADLDELEKRCRAEGVTGLLFGANDFNGTMARQLAKRLNLPIYCESDQAWEIARNKAKFKELCKECGVPVAKDYYLTDALTDEELDQVEYPVVVKPVDMSSNKGMSYCNNREELIAAYKYARSFSSNPRIVVEKQLVGSNVASYYMLAEGKAELAFFTSSYHQPGELANLYSLECMTPCDLQLFLDEVNGGMKKVFEKAGCREGICWSEYILDQDGHIYALEMGYRMAGPGLYPLYERITGFNTARWLVESNLGMKHTEDQMVHKIPAFSQCAATYYLFSNCEDRVSILEGQEKLKQNPDFIVELFRKPGDDVIYHTAVGMVKIYAENVEDLCEKVRIINSTLKIENSQGKNMYIRFDDFETVKRDYARGQADFHL